MADNITLSTNIGTGSTLATDDVSGKHYQRVKIDLGGTDATSPLVRGQQNKAGSLPVTLASDEDELTVALSATDNAVLDTINTAVEKIDNPVFASSFYT